MDLIQIISKSLKIHKPYYIDDIKINEMRKEINVMVKTTNKEMKCPNCDKQSKIHDRLNKKWRHIDIISYQVFVTYKTPRIRCEEHGVKLSSVDWAYPRHHFTKEMEEYIYNLSKDIPLKHIGKIVNEHDTRIKRIIKGVNNEKNN